MAANSSALIVAADSYEDRTLQPLRTPATDADALGQVLRDPEIGAFEVEVLLNEPQSTVKQALEAFFKDRRLDDVLLLHFACHGVADQWRNLYFAMRDTDVKSLASTAIEQTWIRTLMERSRARRKILILDCCFSGLALKGTRAGGRVDVVEGFEVEERPGKEASGIAVMTATSAMEYAVDEALLTVTDGQSQTSVFTTALVQGLQSGEAADKRGWVTFDSLYDYVSDSLIDQGATQTPERSVSGRGDLRIAKKAKPKPGMIARAADRIDYSPLQQLFVLHGTGAELFSIALSPDTRMLVAGTDSWVLAWQGDDPLRRWRRDALPEPMEFVSHGNYVYSVAFSPHGELLASAGEDGVVLITNVVTGETRPTRERHREAVYSVEFSPDGGELATGGWDGQVILWDSRTGNVQRRIEGIGRVSSLAFSPPRRDQRRLLAIGSLDNTITLWDRTTGSRERLGSHQSSVEAVAWSPQGEEELLASCGLDKAIRVWDVGAGAERWMNDTEHGYLVRTVAFSPEGSTLASASWDKRMRLWDVATREPREMPRDDDWETHTDWIWSVAFSRDGLLLASAGSDSKVIVWGLPDDDPVRSSSGSTTSSA